MKYEILRFINKALFTGLFMRILRFNILKIDSQNSLMGTQG